MSTTLRSTLKINSTDLSTEAIFCQHRALSLMSTLTLKSFSAYLKSMIKSESISVDIQRDLQFRPKNVKNACRP